MSRFSPSRYKYTGDVVTTGSQTVLGKVTIRDDGKASTVDALYITAEVGTPPRPSDGEGGVLYVKSDGLVYWRSFEQDEVSLTSGGSGGGGSGTVSSSFPHYVGFYTGSYGSPTTGITGSSNFFWDNNNNRLGLGVTDPDTTLEVNGNVHIGSGTHPGSSTNLFVRGGTTGTLYSEFRNESGADSAKYLLSIAATTASLNFEEAGGSNVKASISSEKEYSNAGNLIFSVKPEDDNIAPAMTISSSGFIGINLETPEYDLHVSGAIGVTGSNPRIYGSTTSQHLQLSNTQGINLTYGTNLGTVAIDNSVYLQTAGFTRLFVKDSTDTQVGVGTTAPGSTLDIYHNSSADKVFRVRSLSSGSAMVVKPTGYIGLNSDSPISRLYIAQKADTKEEGFSIYDSSETYGLRLWSDGSKGVISSPTNEAINISNSGVVTFPNGIGIATFQDPIISGSLVITGSDNSSLLTIKSDSNSAILGVNSNYVTSSVPVYVSSSTDYSFMVEREGELAFRVYKPSSGDAKWQWDNDRSLILGTDTNSSFLSFHPTTSTIRFHKDLYTIDRKVGIGKAPTASLDITGGDATDLVDVRSTSNDNIFVVKGSGNVGIGTDSPSKRLSVQIDEPTENIVELTSYDPYLSTTVTVKRDEAYSRDAATRWFNGGYPQHIISAGNTYGGVVFNELGEADVDFRIESDNNTHMFFIDAGNDKVGINTSSPSHNFTVQGKSAVSSGSFIINDVTEASGSSVSVATTTKTVIDSYSTSTHRMAKYTIHAIDNVSAEIEIAEVILYHSASNAFVSRPFTDYTGANSFMTFSGSVSGGNTQLHVTCVNNNNTISVMRNSLLV